MYLTGSFFLVKPLTLITNMKASGKIKYHLRVFNSVIFVNVVEEIPSFVSPLMKGNSIICPMIPRASLSCASLKGSTDNVSKAQSQWRIGLREEPLYPVLPAGKNITSAPNLVPR